MHSRNDFEKAYLDYSDKIFRFLVWKSGDVELAEDLTSEAFIRAWRSRDKYRGGSLQAWLYAIARNALTDHWRKAKPLSIDELEIEPSYDPQILAQIAGLEAAQQLKDAVAKLEDPGKTVIILRFTENLSVAEVGRALNLTAANVRVIQHRTLQLLKKIMEHHETII